MILQFSRNVKSGLSGIVTRKAITYSINNFILVSTKIHFQITCTFTVGKLLFPQSEESWACCTFNIVKTLVFYSRLPGLNRHWIDLVHPLSVNYLFHTRNKVGSIFFQHCTNVANQQSISYIGPIFNR